MSNLLWPRFLKKAYRQEPITSFRATIMAIAIFARWQQSQKSQQINQEEAARYYLPPQSGQVALPTLKNEKNRPS